MDHNQDQLTVMEQAISGAGIQYDGCTTSDGAAALALLEQRTFVPDLVVLDVNLPVSSGLDLLSRIKHSPELRHIPVVVFTACTDRDVVSAAYDMMANCVVAKPEDEQELESVARSIASFWLSCAILPGVSRIARFTGLRALGF